MTQSLSSKPHVLVGKAPPYHCAYGTRTHWLETIRPTSRDPAKGTRGPEPLTPDTLYPQLKQGFHKHPARSKGRIPAQAPRTKELALSLPLSDRLPRLPMEACSAPHCFVYTHVVGAPGSRGPDTVPSVSTPSCGLVLGGGWKPSSARFPQPST